MAHTFADDYGEYNWTARLDWLIDQTNNCQWKEDIPEWLKLNEPGYDDRIGDFIKHHQTEAGALHWHMFCLTAYSYELRTPVEQIGADKIIGYTNTTGNDIFTVEGAIAPDKAHRPQLEKHHAAFYGRLFNYYHCFLEGRVFMFKTKARGNKSTHKCPACGCVFGSRGYVYEDPVKDVIATEWNYKEKLENAGSSLVDEGTKI